MMMPKNYVQWYYHGTWENTNTHTYPRVSRLHDPDAFQITMSRLTNNSCKDHLLRLEMVLARLSTAGIRMNIFKSKFFAEQIEYLGYWITRQGIQPIRNKVEAILNIKATKTRKEEPTSQVHWYIQLLSRHVVSKK
jgi:hypothetical protein